MALTNYDAVRRLTKEINNIIDKEKSSKFPIFRRFSKDKKIRLKSKLIKRIAYTMPLTLEALQNISSPEYRSELRSKLRTLEENNSISSKT